MGNLKTFASSKYTVVKGTSEHDIFMSHVTETLALEPDEFTYMITPGNEQLVVPVTHPKYTVTSGIPSGYTGLKKLYLGAPELSGHYELAKGLADDPAMDISTYLLMTAGRLHGNYLRAELLDGEGHAFVRFGAGASVTFERTEPVSGGQGYITRFVAFRSTMHHAARRVSQAV